jgi:hypothetical protein
MPMTLVVRMALVADDQNRKVSDPKNQGASPRESQVNAGMVGSLMEEYAQA